MAAERKILGIFQRKRDVQTPHPTEFQHTPIIPPAEGKEKEMLERDCEKILSMEDISELDFNSYVDKMIKILGSGGIYTPLETRKSNLIQQAEENHTIAINFLQYAAGKYSITTHYEIFGEEEEILPKGEEIWLNHNPEEFAGEYFAKVRHDLDGNEFDGQSFRSFAVDRSIKLKHPSEQIGYLNRRETLSFLKRTFDVYKHWRDHSEVFEINLGDSRYKVDYHQIESKRVWTPIENPSANPNPTA